VRAQAFTGFFFASQEPAGRIRPLALLERATPLRRQRI
jgi:hypothetical protein